MCYDPLKFILCFLDLSRFVLFSNFVCFWFLLCFLDLFSFQASSLHAPPPLYLYLLHLSSVPSPSLQFLRSLLYPTTLLPVTLALPLLLFYSFTLYLHLPLFLFFPLPHLPVTLFPLPFRRCRCLVYLPFPFTLDPLPFYLLSFPFLYTFTRYLYLTLLPFALALHPFTLSHLCPLTFFCPLPCTLYPFTLYPFTLYPSYLFTLPFLPFT